MIKRHLDRTVRCVGFTRRYDSHGRRIRCKRRIHPVDQVAYEQQSDEEAPFWLDNCPQHRAEE